MDNSILCESSACLWEYAPALDHFVDDSYYYTHTLPSGNIVSTKLLPEVTLYKAKVFFPKLFGLLDESKVNLCQDSEQGGYGIIIDGFEFIWTDREEIIVTYSGHLVGHLRRINDLIA